MEVPIPLHQPSLMHTRTPIQSIDTYNYGIRTLPDVGKREYNAQILCIIDYTIVKYIYISFDKHVLSQVQIKDGA